MRKFIPFLILFVLIAASDFGAVTLYKKQNAKQQESEVASVTALQKQISGLQSQLTSVSKQNTAAALSAQEVANRQIIVQQKSQQGSVTAAVTKATPAVVSVIISKDVPLYKVVYQNPFGDDPFFQNFGMQIPVYQPTGQTQSKEVGAGSGFIITSNGYILTNKHVVADAQANYTVLLSNGKQEAAQVIYRDPTNDIAIIKIAGSGYQTVTLGDSTTLQLGQTVIAIGNALGQYNNSVSLGIVSGMNRTIQAADENGNTETLTGIIQTDAAINPGNSGGPLIDLNGNAIGINVATAQGANSISFSIPINTIKSIVQKVIGNI